MRNTFWIFMGLSVGTYQMPLDAYTTHRYARAPSPGKIWETRASVDDEEEARDSDNEWANDEDPDDEDLRTDAKEENEPDVSEPEVSEPEAPVAEEPEVEVVEEPVTLDTLKARMRNLSEAALDGEFLGIYPMVGTLHKAFLSLGLHRSFVFTGQASHGKRQQLYHLIDAVTRQENQGLFGEKIFLELDLDRILKDEDSSSLFIQEVEDCLEFKDQVILVIPEMNRCINSSNYQGEHTLAELETFTQDGLQILGTFSTSSFVKVENVFEDPDSMDLISIDTAEYQSMLEKLKHRRAKQFRDSCLRQFQLEAANLLKPHNFVLSMAAAEAAMDFAMQEFEDWDEETVIAQALFWVDACVVEMYYNQVQGNSRNNEIGKGTLYQVYSLINDVPIEEVGAAQHGFSLHDPLALPDRIRQRIVGQDLAVDVVSNSIMTTAAGFNNPEQPIGTFLFLGPTGVGKTELAKVVTAELYGNSNAMVRIDMSEYQEEHRISTLIGSPPGYVGCEDGGRLTEAIKEKPHSLVLLDEIEKAHPKILKLFLQVFDEGHLTDGMGETVDCRQCLFIMTSNLLSSDIGEMANNGFSQPEIVQAIKPTLMEHLSPELYNRFRAVVPFNPISDDIIMQVVPIMLNGLRNELRERKDMELTWDAEVMKWLGKNGYDPDLGLRPLKRLVRDHIPELLSKAYLRGKVTDGDSLHLYISRGEVAVRKSD